MLHYSAQFTLVNAEFSMLWSLYSNIKSSSNLGFWTMLCHVMSHCWFPCSPPLAGLKSLLKILTEKITALLHRLARYHSYLQLVEIYYFAVNFWQIVTMLYIDSENTLQNHTSKKFDDKIWFVHIWYYQLDALWLSSVYSSQCRFF